MPTISSLPAPYLQQEDFTRLQLAVDAIVDLGPSNNLRTGRRPDRANLFGAGPQDEYLAFGLTWWRYLTSGAAQFLSPGPVLDNLRLYAAPSVSLGACALGMSRTLLHLSQLDDIQYAKTRDGMIRARHLAFASAQDPAIADALSDFKVDPWPPAAPKSRNTHPRTAAGKKRRRIASKNFALISGVPDVSLHEVDHEYLLRLCQIQGAIDTMRAHTEPYGLPWGPPGFFDPATDLGPAWATFYHCAVAHAVGGTAGRARLAEIGVTLNAETCLAGVAETYNRLRALNPRDLPAAFASIDCSDFYFDPAPPGR